MFSLACTTRILKTLDSNGTYREETVDKGKCTGMQRFKDTVPFIIREFCSIFIFLVLLKV